MVEPLLKKKFLIYFKDSDNPNIDDLIDKSDKDCYSFCRPTIGL